MIERLEINGVHFDVDDDLRKYVGKKIGRLDRFMSRASSASVHAEVKLKEGKAKDKSARTCEILLHLPHENITIQETTINMYAAIDIAEAKLKMQLKKYKDLHEDQRLHRRVLDRFRHDLAQ